MATTEPRFGVPEDERSAGPRGSAPPTDAPYEDPQMDANESLVTDDLAADPLDTGVAPPDRYIGSEDYQGLGDYGAMDRELSAEMPDVDPYRDEAPRPVDDRWTGGPGPRSGRLVLRPGDPGGLVAEDVGVDCGAASAEEAAMHITRSPRSRK